MVNNKYKNIAAAKAREREVKNKILKVNPYVDDKSGIYFLTRIDEAGIKHAYIGKAEHLLTRLSQHLLGYDQYIDRSLKKHKLYSNENYFGWKIGFEHFEIDELDSKEQYYIREYANDGYQLKNKNSGGTIGKVQIDEYRPSKGYHDGLRQGRKNLARELSHIIEKHLEITLKEGKKNNKVSQNALEKFQALLTDTE